MPHRFPSVKILWDFYGTGTFPLYLNPYSSYFPYISHDMFYRKSIEHLSAHYENEKLQHVHTLHIENCLILSYKGSKVATLLLLLVK